MTFSNFFVLSNDEIHRWKKNKNIFHKKETSPICPTCFPRSKFSQVRKLCAECQQKIDVFNQTGCRKLPTSFWYLFVGRWVVNCYCLSLKLSIRPSIHYCPITTSIKHNNQQPSPLSQGVHGLGWGGSGRALHQAQLINGSDLN